MYVPDIRVGADIRRYGEKTGKPLKPAVYVWHQGKCCGAITACPLAVSGTLRKDLGRCPFCGGKR